MLMQPVSTVRPDRTALVAALAARQLDRTLTSALPAIDPTDDQAVGATTIAALDLPLGGFPRGQCSEIVGPRSSGRTSLLMRLIAAATARGELVALVDALDRFDPESALAAGVDLDRLLWVRGQVLSHPGACKDANQRALEQAIKALSLVLQAGNIGLVVLDVGDAPLDALRRLPFTTWRRVQRMIDGQQTIGVVLGSESMARSAGGLTLTLAAGTDPVRRASAGPRPDERARHDGRRFTGVLFDGLDVTARVVRAHGHRHHDVAMALATGGAARG